MLQEKNDKISKLKQIKSVTICSACFSVICSVIGLLISILAGTPVGSTIVATDLVVFLICTIVVKIKR